jgi:hypothetical protein
MSIWDKDKPETKVLDCAVTKERSGAKSFWYIAYVNHGAMDLYHVVDNGMWSEEPRSLSVSKPNIIVKDKSRRAAIIKLTNQLSKLGYIADFTGDE